MILLRVKVTVVLELTLKILQRKQQTSRPSFLSFTIGAYLHRKPLSGKSYMAQSYEKHSDPQTLQLLLHKHGLAY